MQVLWETLFSKKETSVQKRPQAQKILQKRHGEPEPNSTVKSPWETWCCWRGATSNIRHWIECTNLRGSCWIIVDAGGRDRHTYTACLKKLTEHPLLLPEGHISHILEGYVKEDSRDTALVSWILASWANRNMQSFGTGTHSWKQRETHTKDHCWTTYDQRKL